MIYALFSSHEKHEKPQKQFKEMNIIDSRLLNEID